jgi:hypothetical protein
MEKAGPRVRLFHWLAVQEAEGDGMMEEIDLIRSTGRGNGAEPELCTPA